MKIPLGGKEQDYDSKKSRERLINMIAEVNRDGTYLSVKRLEGLTSYVTFSLGPIRSNLLVNAGFIYVVSGSTLFRVNTSLVPETLGVVGGSNRCQILANSIPGDSQILTLNGDGLGFVYSNFGGFVQITDLDFLPTVSGTILDERFWFARTDTNEFFGSDIGTGLAYDPLTFASAEESPDLVRAVIAKKSALWPIGTDTLENWQTFDNDTLPLRRVKGATKERGISAISSLAEIGNSFAWLADDGTVRLMTDTTMTTISDLELELKIRGNGTNSFPGFTKTDDAIGFFIDGPIHKRYYLVFPSEGYVWGYDLKTKATHSRESEGLDVWRVNSATLFDNKIIVGDSIDGKLWILDPDAKDEDGSIMRATIQAPTISFPHDVSIPLIEIDMEVGTTTDVNADPKMIVSYTKDGETYTVHSVVSLGKIGERRTRVPLRMFGRVVRFKDFGIKLEITDAERFQIYGADAIIEGGF